MFKAVSYKKIISLSLFASAALAVWAIPYLASAQAGVGDALLTGLSRTLWTIVNSVFGFFLGIAGGLLNSGVTNYVVGFGEMYRNSGLGFSIDSLWSTVRDIFNLTFIFGLVFIGFKMIFNTSDSSARRMLVSLVLAALLVNFSLFITKFIIDFSNIAATQFAQAFNVGGTYTISDSFMNLFGLSTALDNLPTGAGFTYIFGMMFLYIIAIFVFAAGGLLLIIRFVVLNIYMVLSPVMFIGWVFPGLSGASKAYWQGFLGRAFFAPAYILMLYFAHQILVNMQGVATNGANLASAFQSGSQYNASLTIIPFFVIIAGFLIASLVVAQKMGAEGASSAIALGRRMTGRARKMAVGGAGYFPRVAANAAGARLEKNLNNLQSKSGVRARFAKTNFADKIERGIATKLKTATFGTGSTNAADAAYKQKTLSRANQTAAENSRSEAFDNNLKTLTNTEESTENLGKAFDELSKSIRGMSKDEKNGLKLEQLTNKSVAVNLSDDDIKNLEASGNFSAAEVQQVKDARKQGFSAIATSGNTLTSTNASGIDRRQSIVSRGVADVGAMPVDVFTQPSMYAYLTPQMINEKIKKGGFTNEEQGKVVGAINTYLENNKNNPNVLKSWSKWANEDTNGLRMGINIPTATQTSQAQTAPSIIIPSSAGGGPRPRT